MDRFDEAGSTATEALAREIEWFRGRPEEYMATGTQAANAMMLGQRRQAQKMFEQAADMARRRERPPPGGMVTLHEVLIGDCSSVGPESGVYELAFCGDADLALRTVEERTQRNPTVTAWNRLDRPLTTAIVALRRGRPEEAINALDPATSHELYNPLVTYVRGRAYLEMGDGWGGGCGVPEGHRAQGHSLAVHAAVSAGNGTAARSGPRAPGPGSHAGGYRVRTRRTRTSSHCGRTLIQTSLSSVKRSRSTPRCGEACSASGSCSTGCSRQAFAPSPPLQGSLTRSERSRCSNATDTCRRGAGGPSDPGVGASCGLDRAAAGAIIGKFSGATAYRPLMQPLRVGFSPRSAVSLRVGERNRRSCRHGTAALHALHSERGALEEGFVNNAG